MQTRQTWFASDIHLCESAPERTKAFCAFLQAALEESIDALYLLGDLFDVWMGADLQDASAHALTPYFQAFFEKGIPVYFLHGNRDFLLETTQLEKWHIQRLPDPCVIDIYHTRVLLTHGDLLCTEDKTYQRYRAFVQSTLFKKLFLALAKTLRQKLARKMRQRSQISNASKKAALMDVCPQTTQHLMQQAQVQRLIHGHTHQANLHDIPLGNNIGQRLVLGDWSKTGGHYACLNPAEMSLIAFSCSDTD